MSTFEGNSDTETDESWNDVIPEGAALADDPVVGGFQAIAAHLLALANNPPDKEKLEKIHTDYLAILEVERFQKQQAEEDERTALQLLGADLDARELNIHYKKPTTDLPIWRKAAAEHDEEKKKEAQLQLPPAAIQPPPPPRSMPTVMPFRGISKRAQRKKAYKDAVAANKKAAEQAYFRVQTKLKAVQELMAEITAELPVIYKAL